MAGAYICWRNYVDDPDNTLWDDDGIAVSGSHENLRNPQRNRRWVGPAQKIDGNENQLGWLWGSAKPTRVVALLDHDFSDAPIIAALDRATSVTPTFQVLNNVENLTEGDELAPHAIYTAPDGIDTHGVRIRWNEQSGQDTVSASRLWASDALYLPHGIDVESPQGYERSRGLELSRGRQAVKEREPATPRTLRITMSQLTVEQVFGDPVDDSAPCLHDLAMYAGKRRDVLILLSTQDDAATRRRAIYGRLSKGLSVTSGGPRYVASMEAIESH